MAEEIEVEEVAEETQEAAAPAPAVIGDGLARVFKFGDRSVEDPGHEFSDEDVLNQIASSLPEFANGKITREVTGDDRFVTVTITKAPKRLG